MYQSKGAQIPFQRGEAMSTDAEDNTLLDGIAELMLLPLKEGQCKKVEAQITVEVDEKDGRMKLSAMINSPQDDAKK